MDATHQPNVCVQDLEITIGLAKNFSMKLVEIPGISEDCLYLNIYTPSKSSENSKLPVMVWIHGGGFILGGVFIYDGSALAAYQHVVVVEIQYRLGILGFFSTGDEHAPGNMGLLDQVEALRWVQQHIHNFGGDPNSVTIFGESAGGVSVSLLLLSPLSPGLVQGAIAESGTALIESVLVDIPLPIAKATDQWISELIADEYLGTSGDRIKIRDGFTQLVGDVMFIFPALNTANFHRDAGVPVYFYEFQETAELLKPKRPSFVGSDHGDELAFVFGFCFTESQLLFDGSCTKEDEQLSRTMMKYWGNFARTGSPNGEGLAHWPLYGAEGDYLAIGLEQVPSRHLKKDRFTFMTQTISEQIKLHKEKIQQSEQPKTGPVVQTKQGSLRGEYVSVKGKETVLQAYLGIPFAKPPVGPLRLASPQPADGWEGVRDATRQPHMCPQDRELLIHLISQYASLVVDIPDVSEDCLYLNIYTPAKPGQDAKLPVMVWIHGGALISGSASILDGSVLAAYQDVVVVQIQYRLGLLGFLSTGDQHISGNMGLLDQVEALRWVNKNIQNFGGDPNSVTVFGESAGGISVSLLLLSPLSNGLVHRAIAESGTAAMDLLLIHDPLPIAQAEDEFIRHLVADEYLGTSGDQLKYRKGFTELLGDLLFNIPAIKTANVHRDAGAPVYLYEYQHILQFLREKRPAFVGVDHGDELAMVFGFCFPSQHVKIDGVCTEDEEQLSRTIMSYWGNFARTGSPNGEGLAHWPQYGAEQYYLGIGLEQVPGQHLKKDRYTFMTKTLPEQIRLHKEKMERIEL
ncbi:cocaine esterase [Aplochiton taeniatus]